MTLSASYSRRRMITWATLWCGLFLTACDTILGGGKTPPEMGAPELTLEDGVLIVDWTPIPEALEYHVLHSYADTTGVFTDTLRAAQPGVRVDLKWDVNTSEDSDHYAHAIVHHAGGLIWVEALLDDSEFSDDRTSSPTLDILAPTSAFSILSYCAGYNSDSNRCTGWKAIVKKTASSYTCEDEWCVGTQRLVVWPGAHEIAQLNETVELSGSSGGQLSLWAQGFSPLGSAPPTPTISVSTSF